MTSSDRCSLGRMMTFGANSGPFGRFDLTTTLKRATGWPVVGRRDSCIGNQVALSRRYRRQPKWTLAPARRCQHLVGSISSRHDRESYILCARGFNEIEECAFNDAPDHAVKSVAVTPLGIESLWLG